MQYAVEAEERQAARASLTDWREAATQGRTLARHQAGQQRLIERIDRAIALISSAEEGLGDQTRTPKEATSHVRERIRDAGDSVMEIVIS
jgi:hypothetical protein